MSSPKVREGDVFFMHPVRRAHLVEAAPAAMWAVWLMFAAVTIAIGWAALAQVDIVVRATARVIPEGREQVIASLEGGILRELLVREGQQVTEGQDVALLDPTRFEAQQAEGQVRRLALMATAARLQAEATGRPLSFPDALKDARAVVDGETDSFQARQHALNDAVEMNRRSIALLSKELAVAEAMSAKGLMSEVEVMRVRRQVNDLNLGVQERVNRFRQDAASELVKVRSELSLLEEQMVVRDDALRRTALKSPVRGIVKQIRANTIGGVIAPGAAVMEIVPMSAKVLVEARVKPQDIGFVKAGQDVTVKLSAYDYTVYGGLSGKVETISPDVLGDGERAGQVDATYYRTLVRADAATLQPPGGKTLTVLPGMSGTVEVRTGRRSVLSFLVRPMMRSREAFSER